VINKPYCTKENFAIKYVREEMSNTKDTYNKEQSMTVYLTFLLSKAHRIKKYVNFLWHINNE
jgi:hypothetical protein